MQAAERELGYAIFARSASGVTPTKEGEEALLIASEIVERYRSLAAIGAAEKPSLSVSVNSSISELFFAEIYAKLYLTLPTLRLRTYKIPPETFLATHKARDDLHGIAIDCCLERELAQTEALAERQGYRLERLSGFRLMAYINRANPLSNCEGVTREMLRGQNYLFAVDPLKSIPPRKPIFDRNFVVADGGAYIPLLQIVNTTDTIGIFPEYKNLPFSPAFNDYTEVIPVPIVGEIEPECSYAECLISPRKARFSAEEKAFLELIRSAIHD